MPKMMPKKMTVNEALTMVMEEYGLPVISDEEKVNREIDQCYADYAKELAFCVAQEMEIAWNEHDWEEFMRNADDDLGTADYVRKYFEELDAANDPIQEQTGPQKDMKAAKRRKQKARHKKKVRRNAINAVKNNAKRGEDDQKATASRGGFVVGERKSRTMKTDRIKTQAEKMKLVTDEDFGF